MIHSNSIEAHTEERDRGRLSKRAQAIMEVFQGQRWTWAATDRGIAHRMNFQDMNSVRPRITELIKAGKLEECGSMRDPATGKRVRLVRLRQGQQGLF